jgi:peroxiredoxin
MILNLLLSWLTFFTFILNDGLKPGDKAPDFNLKNVNGKMVSLTDFSDAKGYIIIFTCNHCP